MHKRILKRIKSRLKNKIKTLKMKMIPTQKNRKWMNKNP